MIILIGQGKNCFAFFRLAVFKGIQDIFIPEAAEFAMSLRSYCFHGIYERKGKCNDKRSEKNTKKYNKAPAGTSYKLSYCKLTSDRSFFPGQYPSAFAVVADLSCKQLHSILGKQPADAKQGSNIVYQCRNDYPGDSHPYRQIEFRLHRLIIGKPEGTERC